MIDEGRPWKQKLKKLKWLEFIFLRTHFFESEGVRAGQQRQLVCCTGYQNGRLVANFLQQTSVNKNCSDVHLRDESGSTTAAWYPNDSEVTQICHRRHFCGCARNTAVIIIQPLPAIMCRCLIVSWPYWVATMKCKANNDMWKPNNFLFQMHRKVNLQWVREFNCSKGFLLSFWLRNSIDANGKGLSNLTKDVDVQFHHASVSQGVPTWKHLHGG